MNRGLDFWRAISIAKKEIRHILRDPFTLTMAVGMPVLLVTFFGFIINFDVQDIALSVINRDHTRASRDVVDVFTSSNYFNVKNNTNPGNPFQPVDAEKVKAVLVIEKGFAKEWREHGAASVQVAIDGADNQAAGIIGNYLAGIRKAVQEKLSGQEMKPPVELRTRFLFNEELNSRWFVVPGLAVVVIGILSILLTALTVAREWENGSMELLLSTPVRPLEIIIGKLLPYTVLGLAGVTFVYVAARLAFGVPFRGSHLLFGLACLLFLGTALAQGLVISVVTRQQQLAMQMANITGMLPSFMLSGFIFPIESMPVVFQYLTFLLAPRWLMIISRSEFLKGSTFLDLALPLGMLALIMTLLLTIALKKFKKDLEP